MFNVIDVLGFFYFGLLGNLVVVAVDFLEDCSVEFLLGFFRCQWVVVPDS